MISIHPSIKQIVVVSANRFWSIATLKWVNVKLKNKLLLQYLVLIGVCCLFTFPATVKLIAIDSFRIGLLNSPLIPEWSIQVIQWAVPAICFFIPALVLLGFWFPQILKWGLVVAQYWLCVCTLYILAILTVADYVPCECLGIAEWISWGAQLTINMVLIYIIWLLKRGLKHQQYSLQRWENLHLSNKWGNY